MPALLRRAGPDGAIGRDKPRWPALLVGLGIVGPCVWAWWARLTAPSDGTLLFPESGRDRVEIVSVYRPGSPLHAGDVVRAINGVSMDDWAAGRGPHVTRHVGDVLRYTIERGGAVFDVRVPIKGYPLADAARSTGVLLALAIVLLAVVSTVFLIRPRDVGARLMFLVGVALLCVTPEYPFGLQAVDLTAGHGLAGYVGADIAGAIMWSAVLYFTLVFPEPVAILRRRPALGLICFTVPFVLWLVSLSWTLPGTSGVARLYTLISISAMAARVIPALVAIRLLQSYFTTRDAGVRRRLRWIIGTLLVGLAAYLGLGQIPDALGHGPIIGYQWLLLFMLPVPLAVAAGILRYRWFDIEVILSRSLLVGALTGLIAIVYAVVVVALPHVDARPSTLLALIIGGAVAIVAFAARNSLGRRITKLVYGDRNDPHAVVSQLSALNTVETDSVLREVVSTLATALRLPYVRLELVGPNGVTEVSAAYGTPSGQHIVLPINAEGTLLGRLELDAGAGREPFGPADQRLLDDLASQLSGAARTVLLARALQRSRERLVLAREEERRRLQRDLHDGVGPTLAAQSMQLEVAAGLVRTDPDAAARLLTQLGSSTQSLIAEVRHIVEDLRPATLNQLGLVSSIREHTRTFDGVRGDEHPEGFAVQVDADTDLGELPAAVEVAAFRIAVEAVTNAARYSRGRSCVVRLSRTDSLFISIVDDGAGLQPRIGGSGVGLISMQERAAELGGECVITSRTDTSGTVVRVRIPVSNLEAAR